MSQIVTRASFIGETGHGAEALNIDTNGIPFALAIIPEPSDVLLGPASLLLLRRRSGGTLRSLGKGSCREATPADGPRQKGVAFDLILNTERCRWRAAADRGGREPRITEMDKANRHAVTGD